MPVDAVGQPGGVALAAGGGAALAGGLGDGGTPQQGGVEGQAERLRNGVPHFPQWSDEQPGPAADQAVIGYLTARARENLAGKFVI